ncbi:MAG: Rieske 2Fe-2S domain-containing protein [Thermodesulfobacteriota bacterium]
MDESAQTGVSRRYLLKALSAFTWAGLVGALGLGLGAVLRLISADSGPSAAGPVELGPAAGLALGQVRNVQQVALVRDAGGLYALHLVCPHLGCRPAWHAGQRRFLCPCHGSIFAPDGSRLSGPAPRGLDHIALGKSAQGGLIAYPGRPAPAAARLKV